MSDASFHEKVARGAAWAFASTWSRIVISLFAFAVIARIIGPESFGQNTMAGALVSLCTVLVGSAMGEVIVQREDLPPGLLAAYFWLLQLMAWAIFALLISLRHVIADRYGVPAIAGLLTAYAFTVPLTALQTVPEAQLSRHMQFRVQALGGGAGIILGSLAGIGLALWGAGAWSIVALQLVQTLVQMSVIWTGSRWWPGSLPDWSGMPALLRYSSSSVGARLLNELDNQLPKVIIGSMLGATSLGFYAIARRIFDLLREMLIVPLNMIALPSIAKARLIGYDASKLFESAIRVSTSIANPAFLGLLAIAPLLVPVMFGQPWLPAVLILQLTSLIGLRSAVNSFNGAALRAYGKPFQQVLLAGLGVGMTVAFVSFTGRYGLTAMVIAVVVRNYATWPIAAMLVGRLGLLPAYRQLTVGMRSLLASAIMAVAVSALRIGLQSRMPAAGLLGLCIGLGGLIYAALIYLSAPAEFRETLDMTRRILSGSRGKPAVPA